MRYTHLGTSGLRVSSLCVGTGTLGSRWGPSWTTTRSDADRIVATALERGVNFFDTANVYHGGESETWLGASLRRHADPADVVVATKFGYRTDPADPCSGGSGRQSMRTSVERSLTRLGRDYVDLLYLHLWDRVTPPEETLAGAGELIAEGKIRAFGLSNVPGWYAGTAAAPGRPDGQAALAVLQLRYSLLDRSAELEFGDFVSQRGCGFVAWGPLADGLLTGRYAVDVEERVLRGSGRVTTTFTTSDIDPFREQVVGVLGRLGAIARELGCTPAQLALAWVLQRSFVSTVAIGISSHAQLVENLAAVEVAVPPEAIAELDHLSAPVVPYPYSFLQPDIQRLVHGEEGIDPRC